MEFDICDFHVFAFRVTKRVEDVNERRRLMKTAEEATKLGDVETLKSLHSIAVNNNDLDVMKPEKNTMQIAAENRNIKMVV